MITSKEILDKQCQFDKGDFDRCEKEIDSYLTTNFVGDPVRINLHTTKRVFNKLIEYYSQNWTVTFYSSESFRNESETGLEFSLPVSDSWWSR